MKKILAAMGLMTSLACSHQQAAVKVDDSGLAQLNENEMAPVDDARIEEGRARDAVAKAQASEAQARARFDVAKSEREVSDAQLKRALAERDLMKKEYARRDAVARADSDVQAAQASIAATDLKLRYLQQMIEVAAAERKAAEVHVNTAAARTLQAKFQAMKTANAPQVEEINGGSIDRQLAEAQLAENGAQREAAEQRSKAVDLYNSWQKTDAQVRAMAQPRNVPVPAPAQAEPAK